ncbi:Two-component system protein A [Tolypocladium ophioglossoides CBS 100239]|uniref:Two-component system protein A n=1 Tax=Tolypocladium ophioglossoides (strain CBS 100239) TaxID=1163406 RepID=A0A0L0NAD8_TOLOC|nr:Two-component system protein A [Tolypocladium ophioglossoides CBS 100239]
MRPKRWLSILVQPRHHPVYKKNAIHVGFSKITRDLSERRKAELRLIAAYDESTKLKNDFLACISHEICSRCTACSLPALSSRTVA